MAKYRIRYVWSKPFGNPKHFYEVIGAKGGLHLHITDYGENSPTRYSAGLEIHYRYPPPYMSEQAPSHDKCDLIKCPCWHDGTSLCAEEQYLPLFVGGIPPEQMLDLLCGEADKRFADMETK